MDAVPFWDWCRKRELRFHNAVTEALKSYVPYNIAVVGFPSLQVRLISNIIDMPPSSLRIGMPLRLTWQECDDGTPLPLFLGEKS